MKKKNMNKLCLFHVPKTGGTSLRKALVQTLGQNKCFPVEKIAPAHYHSARHFNALPLNRRQKIRLVSGHFTIDDLTFLPNFRACLVLRDPKDRAISVTQHFMRNDPKYAASSFGEVLEAISPTQILNFYHKQFSGAKYDKTNPSTDLAFENLKRVEFIGFFDELDRFSKHVAREVFGLKILLEYLNAAPDTISISDENSAQLDELTRLDQVLYDRVRRDRKSNAFCTFFLENVLGSIKALFSENHRPFPRFRRP